MQRCRLSCMQHSRVSMHATPGNRFMQQGSWLVMHSVQQAVHACMVIGSCCES